MVPAVNVSCDFSGHDVLTRPRACDHTAHLYTDSESLLSALEQYVSAGLDRGDAAVIIATRSHIEGLLKRLDADGRDCSGLAESGQLVTLDAEQCLKKIMNGNVPQYEAFQSLATDIIETARRNFGGLCAYGELVNILWHQHNYSAAHTLEGWW